MEKSRSQKSRRRRPNWRGLVTLLVVLSSIVMLISGVVMFVAPSGRVARTVSWTMMGLDRAQWQTLHLSFAVVFVGSGLIHLGFNWRGLLHHLRNRVSKHLTLKWEAVIAVVATIWVVISAILMLPPAGSLHELNEYFRRTFWTDASIAKDTGVPPFPIDAMDKNLEKTGPNLPEGHSPVRADEACSDCHRQ
jgi:hypothetical protein